MGSPTSRSLAILAGMLASAFASLVFAGPVYQPPGANLTLGDVTHRQRLLSAAGNPAAPAADMARAELADGEQSGGIVVSAVAGLEFGDLNAFYDRIDELADIIKPTPPGDGGTGGPPPDEPPDGGIDLGDIIDTCCPSIREWMDRVEREVAGRAALLTLIAVDGYGKAFQSVDIPIAVGKEALGGTWNFSLNWSGSSKAFGVTDGAIAFDADAASADLSSQYDLQPGDPATLFDIVGDVDIVIDPRLGAVRALFDNDSVLITKASQTTELSVGYSRQAITRSAGALFIGVEGKFYDLKLSRVGVRFGDVTDSEALFEAIKNSSFRNDSSVAIDFGMLWVAPRYQLGMSLTNINEPTFVYPEIDTSTLRSASVTNAVLRDGSFTMQRQLKLESSLFTESRRWGLHLGFDANSIEDPMGDAFQWLTLSANLTTSKPSVRSLRFGYRRNLAGTQLDYLGVGGTFFKWFNVDLAVNTDRVRFKDNDVPRGALFSAGFQIQF